MNMAEIRVVRDQVRVNVKEIYETKTGTLVLQRQHAVSLSDQKPFEILRAPPISGDVFT